MVEIQAITIGVAIFGAVIATSALTWNIVSYLIDKPKLTPKYSTGFIRLGKETKPFFAINISNPTKHRIVLKAVGICFENDQTYPFINEEDGFPKVLLQGDSHEVYRDPSIIKKGFEDNGGPKYVWARDATGKVYKGEVSNLAGKINALLEVFKEKK